jgi:hypothetical protein
MQFDTFDIFKNTLHETHYSYYKTDSDEFISLVIDYDRWMPHAFLCTIRDTKNIVHASWGYFKQMWPMIDNSKTIELPTLIREAWLRWMADMENSSTLIHAIDNKFNEDVLKSYIRTIEKEKML